MTRLELATPTLARLCATNCATSACSRIAPGTCKTLPDPSAGAKPSRFPRVGHQPQGLSIRGRSRHPLVSSLALWGLPPNFCTRRSRGNGRLAQLVARFLHTEEVIGSSPVSPTESPRESFDFRGFLLPEPDSQHRCGARVPASVPHVLQDADQPGDECQRQQCNHDRSP